MYVKCVVYEVHWLDNILIVFRSLGVHISTGIPAILTFCDCPQSIQTTNSIVSRLGASNYHWPAIVSFDTVLFGDNSRPTAGTDTTIRHTWTLDVGSNLKPLYLFWLKWEFPLVWTRNTHGLAIRQLLKSHDILCRRIKLRCCSSYSPNNVFPFTTPYDLWHTPPDSTLRQPDQSLLASLWPIIFCIMNVQVILITCQYM